MTLLWADFVAHLIIFILSKFKKKYQQTGKKPKLYRVNIIGLNV